MCVGFQPGRGKWKYADYRKKVVSPTIGDAMAPAPPERPPAAAKAAAAVATGPLPPIPQDLLGVQVGSC